MDMTLGDFVEKEELWGIIFDLVCKECRREAFWSGAVCAGCPVWDMMEEIEDQIGREGIAFMENLAREW